MEKDKITLSAVKEDLLKQERYALRERVKYRLCAIIPFALFASVIALGVSHPIVGRRRPSRCPNGCEPER